MVDETYLFAKKCPLVCGHLIAINSFLSKEEKILLFPLFFVQTFFSTVLLSSQGKKLNWWLLMERREPFKVTLSQSKIRFFPLFCPFSLSLSTHTSHFFLYASLTHTLSLSLCLSVSSSVSLSICLLNCQSLHLSVFLSSCLDFSFSASLSFPFHFSPNEFYCCFMSLQLLSSIHFPFSFSAFWKSCSNTLSQFHQHFMCSFYPCRSQKHKKILTTWLNFYPLGIRAHKPGHKHVGEIVPLSQFSDVNYSNFSHVLCLFQHKQKTFHFHHTFLLLVKLFHSTNTLIYFWYAIWVLKAV